MIPAGQPKVVSIEEGLMKAMLTAICGMIMLTSSLVYGQSDTQMIDQRQTTQEDWIERSFDRGQPERRDAPRSVREPDRLDRRDTRAKADEVVTTKKAARIGAAQKRSPRPVVREQQDRRETRHR